MGSRISSFIRRCTSNRLANKIENNQHLVEAHNHLQQMLKERKAALATCVAQIDRLMSLRKGLKTRAEQLKKDENWNQTMAGMEFVQRVTEYANDLAKLMRLRIKLQRDIQLTQQEVEEITKMKQMAKELRAEEIVDECLHLSGVDERAFAKLMELRSQRDRRKYRRDDYSRRNDDMEQARAEEEAAQRGSDENDDVARILQGIFGGPIKQGAASQSHAQATSSDTLLDVELSSTLQPRDELAAMGDEHESALANVPHQPLLTSMVAIPMAPDKEFI